MKKFEEFLNEGGSAAFNPETLKKMFKVRLDFLDAKLQNRLSSIFNRYEISQKDAEELTDVVEDIYQAGIELEQAKDFPENGANKGVKTHKIKDKS